MTRNADSHPARASSDARPLLHNRRVRLDHAHTTQYVGTATELDAKPSDRDAKENVRPVMYEKRSALASTEAVQYAGTATELDAKQSDRHAKENICRVCWA